MNKWVENAIRLTDINNIACVGGMFLNVKVNKLLRESKVVKDIFFYPAPYDEGSPVGAGSPRIL